MYERAIHVGTLCHSRDISAQSALVFADALFEVVGMPGVIGVIGTTQDVNPEAHGFMLRCFSPFDKLRANGAGSNSLIN